jgi:putative N6-adenine-specific DNA methylase
MSEQFEMIAKTFQGLEEILAEELTALGANDIQIGRRMVSFTGDKRMMYKANFCLRTAIRILKPIKNFTAKDADEVYNEIQAIPWEEYLDVNKTFAIDAVVFSEEFRHSKFVSYKVKDAIVDYFREKTGKRRQILDAALALCAEDGLQGAATAILHKPFGLADLQTLLQTHLPQEVSAPGTRP